MEGVVYELGKMGMQEEGADEQIPRSTRGEQYDSCTSKPIWRMPRGDGDLNK